ncbi:hypothetical protein [Limoniibacter endophyticus]|uniref:Uncharacterized protein n=1 Tax=Limoniibacter endophyticus TaxID=1565040 RepID=A0A8J3DJ21_9HYPH|nr:hypothetical protein [Limoniibacter endophyticus]GHC76578.1 hypothetical protein GCM10010136_27380 [Limoniibacter endophyticus]
MLPRSPILATLLTTVLAGETGALTRRAKATVLFFAAIGLLVAMGLFFALVAGFIATASRFGSVEAAIGFSLGFLVVALILYIAYRLYLANEKKKAKARRAADYSTVGIATALAVAPALLKGNPLMKIGIPAAAVIAYLIFKENTRRSGAVFRNDDRD